MIDPVILLACAIGALLVGFLIMALILEHLAYQVRSTKRRVHVLGAETKRLREMERRREALRNETPLFINGLSNRTSR